ncbi:MAG: TonB-dependent receptor domain-containing protein [Sphingomonas sp.]
MSKPIGLSSLLLISSALVAPEAARAQSAPAADQAPPADAASAADQVAPDQATPAVEQDQAPPEVSVPGGSPGPEIVVVGKKSSSNVVRTTSQIVSILSSADIARTGEGDIAGALARVTGLSVVGNGFVYVRGLGDRYSLALLNGSPLPSPEPLKRVVPLDIFPTSVVASSLVQKSYSANFPGEFGGGVINLTTKAVPKKGFLSFGSSIGANSVTTGQLGYTYFGSASDFTGFDNGTRNLAPALQAYFNSGNRISTGTVNTQAIASQLVTGRNSIIQRNGALPPNWSGNVTGGKSFDLGGASLGLIATAGYSNKWRTRDTLQQTSSSADLSQLENNFERIITDNRIVVNGLVGLGLEFGLNKVRWTNLYIRDTIKQARLGIGQRATTSPTATLQQQDTAFFARQLIDSQIVTELKLTPELELDFRAGYANSKRQAPDEFSYEYQRTNDPNDPLGQFFVNRLNNGARGTASVSYSRLNENLWSTSADIIYRLTPEFKVTVGYAFSNTNRLTERREFLFTAPSSLPNGVALLRPDLLLGPAVIRAFGINLIDTNENNPVFRSTLVNHAGYGQLDWQITPALSLNAGARYESALQRVTPIQVFSVPTASLAGTNLNRNYLLPAATLTYQLRPDMQVRLNASKTIARPQFRELVFQLYFDTDANRQNRGNPRLTDSQLYNGEIRYEWYFARDQRFSVAGFYKRIINPIEAFTSFSDNAVVTSYANAPRATLYGAEIETQKYFDLNTLSDGGFFAARRAVVIANYTYTKSRISVRPNDPVSVFAQSASLASDFFRDGVPLTGQSDHLANVQLGLEDKGRLSQQTLLLTYASERVTSRGASRQPDIIERPGFELDFVARQGVKIAGVETEIKLEVRNITGTRYQEFQRNGANRVFFNRYDIGTTGTLGLSVNF